MTTVSWIVISYALGSIPFGFLISKWSGKNILEIGWKKTSGSNVFKNVGKWQGALTGIMDVIKGYFAVFGAQKLGFSLEIQALAGVAAVIGHNWSIFINFAGGRGIGTFVGGLLALSSKIFLLSFPVILVVALIWNSSIATLLFLTTIIFLSFRFYPNLITGWYTIWTLPPILIKRLSPIKEIFKSDKKLILFRNRILLDNDEALFGLRIKRILSRTDSLPLKILIKSIMLPPKIGWEVAKFGVKVVKTPIDLILKEPEKVVTEIKVEDLKKMMEASAKKIVVHQEEINRINVFPVADKDTGYNLAATLLGIEGVIGQRNYNLISQLSRDIKEGAMINARGNAGMIYTGYLIGLLDTIKHWSSIDALRLSVAMRKGAKSAYSAILNPVEGTILDVLKASASKVYEMAKIQKEKNIIKVLEESFKVSEKALAETKEKLEVLKQNDVVDAGALGFVKILEAWIESLKGITPEKEEKVGQSLLELKPEDKTEYQYEIIFRILKAEKPEIEKLKGKLPSFGNSIDILEMEDQIKIHIHTSSPDKIKEEINNFKILEWKLEDIKTQTLAGKKYLGLIVGDTANLPKEFLERNQIEVVPFRINFPDQNHIEKENFFEKIKRLKKLPTTATATFNDYFNVYKRALQNFEKIIVITPPSRLSGAYSQARIARSIFKKPMKNNIFVFDCFTAEVAEGLVVIKIQERISQAKRVEEILEELKKFCPQVKLLGLISDFRYVVRGGRIKIPPVFRELATLVQKLGIKFLFSLEDGRIKFLGPRFGQNPAQILAKEIEKRSEEKEMKIAISYSAQPELAQELKDILEKNSKMKILYLSQIPPLIGVHTGPGALIVGFYAIDRD